MTTEAKDKTDSAHPSDNEPMSQPDTDTESAAIVWAVKYAKEYEKQYHINTYDLRMAFIAGADFTKPQGQPDVLSKASCSVNCDCTVHCKLNPSNNNPEPDELSKAQERVKELEECVSTAVDYLKAYCEEGKDRKFVKDALHDLRNIQFTKNQI